MVLEGSVRKAGHRRRVTPQRVKVSDGDHLWSERYERDMTDIFAIQDEIAKAIAGRLQVTLDGGEAASLVTPATKNLDAYHLCLKGRYLLAQRGLGLRQALECFDQAIALDPNYALAHAGLAEACTVLAQYGLVPPGMLRAKARAAACRALELAPNLAEAHAAAGAGRRARAEDVSAAHPPGTPLQRAGTERSGDSLGRGGGRHIRSPSLDTVRAGGVLQLRREGGRGGSDPRRADRARAPRVRATHHARDLECRSGAIGRGVRAARARVRRP